MKLPAFRHCAAPVSLRATKIAIGLLLLSTNAAAQKLEPGQFLGAASVFGVAQLNADLDEGGDVEWSSVGGSGMLSWGLTPRVSAGLTLRYAYEDWKFSTPNALSATAPWGAINAPAVGLNFRYQHAPDLSAFVAPQVQWAYETGASAGNAQTYGAVFGVTRTFSPSLTVGLGAGVYRQINRTRAFPFVLVNWQIDDKWRVGNPLQAGPTGGPGLELAYAIDERWELAGGASYRESRFRLRSDGPSSGGIGQSKGIPLFARVSYKLGPKGSIDLYAGAVVGGELKLLDTDGNTISSSDYKTAPLLGISASLAF